MFLKHKMGYRTHAMVSLPVLNPKTILNSGFDSYQLMDKHNDMRAMVKQMKFTEDKPSFYVLNVGETHYPYALPGRAAGTLAADQRGSRRVQAPRRACRGRQARGVEGQVLQPEGAR